MNLLDVFDGDGWSIQQAIQTTFPFDPQFYSNYVRPCLQSRNCELPLVLVDGQRYEREITMSDWQAAPIGIDYLLEPVASPGVFHPKINLFASEQSAFVSVSSANLTLEEYCKAAQLGTSAGFQQSWLTDDEHSIGDAYYLARDARDFYAELADQEGFITGQDARTYIEETVTTLEWLDDDADAVNLEESERTLRLVSNLSRPILSQVIDQVGEVERARLYAPYYGTPNVVRQLAERLDAECLELLVEPESTALDVEGLPEALDDVEYEIRRMSLRDTTRWVHAKFMVLSGDWGQACLFGSPNMTSSALLESAAGGNVEVGVLSVVPRETESGIEDAVFGADAFQFDVSEPITDPSSLDLRSTSYEGWESIREGDSDRLQLADARLTQPGQEEKSELILTLADLTGEHELAVRTESGAEQQTTATIDPDSGEFSVYLSPDERIDWSEAVVTVTAAGRTSNPRRVVEELQAYYREYRDMTRSEGTQSSNTLLREVLENPDTAAIGVFDVALSELRKNVQTGDPASDKPAEREERYGERGPASLTSGGGSLPSLHTLVGHHLTYHRERALASLDPDDMPLPDDIESFVEHARTFWETIELCLLLQHLGELDSRHVQTDQLFGTCADELGEWVAQLGLVVQRLNGIIDQIENTKSVRESFVSGSSTDVADLDLWPAVSEVVFLHPGLVLELEAATDETMVRSKVSLANRLSTVFDELHPQVRQHLLDGTALVEQVQRLVENLSVEFEVDERELDVVGRGVQVLLLTLLIKKICSSESFLEGIRNHPRFSSESIAALSTFALEGEDVIVEYGLVGSVQWSVVLAQARTDLEELATA